MSVILGRLQKILRAVSNAVGNTRGHGLLETSKFYSYCVYERFRDWRLGIDTGGRIDREKRNPSEECFACEEIHYKCLDTVFHYFISKRGSDVLLNYGCGKGRSLATAATYPFRRIIGVEPSLALGDITRANIRRASRHRICNDVEVITSDAASFRIPPDVNAVSLLNSFSRSILSSIQEQLRQTLQNCPRLLRVAHVHPRNEANAFEGCNWLSKECELPTGWRDKATLVVYRSNCAARRHIDYCHREVVTQTAGDVARRSPK